MKLSILIYDNVQQKLNTKYNLKLKKKNSFFFTRKKL